jgi:hypothetical protein
MHLTINILSNDNTKILVPLSVNRAPTVLLRPVRASCIMLTSLLALCVLGCTGFVAPTKRSSPLSISPPQSTSILRIMTTSLPVAAVQSVYRAQLIVSGGIPPYSWITVGGQLPSGLILNPVDGTLTGTPTWAGSFSFTLAVRDRADSSVSTGFSLNVSTLPAPAISVVSPNTGWSDGGTVVTVFGSNFRPGAVARFGNIPPLSLQFVDSNHLVVETAAEPSASVNVSVENSDGQIGTAPAAFKFLPASAASNPVGLLPNADILIDSQQSVSETGADDLAAAKNIYASASAPESNGGLSPDWDLISSELEMKRMRNINGLRDCSLDTVGHLTGCTRLNNDLSDMMAKNLTPHVVVGQWAPSSIGGNPLKWNAAQWAQYDALCYAIVDYVVNRFGGTGFHEALFEVENELDTTTNPEDLWLTTTPTVHQGDPSRFAQFDTVYAHWAAAVSRVASNVPNKSVRIAGPATGFWTVYYGSGQLWHNEIIQKYAAAKTRLDVVSIHVYGGQVEDLARLAQSIRKTLISAGNPRAEIWVTEWGASDSADGHFGSINGSHQSAAWAINFLLQALKGTVTGGSFLEVRDNHGPDLAGVDANMNAASWLHVHNMVEYPKAITNAFSMVSHMTGVRRSVEVNPAKPNLRALASSSSDSASLIVANYNYLFDYANKNYSDLTSREVVTVTFKNLPFNGPVTVDRYLIDAQTSNLDYWVATGKAPPSVRQTQLQKVESFPATSTSGTLALPQITVGKSAVSMWVVHR